jgi:glutamate synthase domain-containing protein 3
MAGGVLILLGLTLPDGADHKAKYVGTGMHGGVIYIQGNIPAYHLGKEVGTAELDEKDQSILMKHVVEYAVLFNRDAEEILSRKFTKLYPKWLRPYGRLYVY